MDLLEDNGRMILSAIRCALWGEESEELLHVSWVELLRTAEEQTVFGLAFRAFEYVQPKGIDQDLLFEYIGQSIQIGSGNSLVNERLRDFVGRLNTLRIKFCIVKGQTVGTCYPEPMLRQVGDIDFWVHPRDVSKCEAYIEEELNCGVQCEKSEKHVEFLWEDILFEMHYRLASFGVGRDQRYFDKLIENDSSFAVEIDGVEVPTLSPTLNALYIFVHLFHHLIGIGVGLRQFCDWMMWLHRYKDEINRDELNYHIFKLGLQKAYRTLGAILVYDLGLPVSEFPLRITEKDRKRSRNVLKNVMEMGNFGQNKRVAQSLGLMRSIQTGVRMCIQGFKYFDLAPKRIACRFLKRMWWYLGK